VHLSEAQLDRYALLVDATVEALHQHGRRTADLVCEVLSTMPYPLGCVLSRHGLGRFRVTQKADPRNPDDPYRPDHARSEDWVMLGTHDTPPVWSVVEGWRKAGDLRDRAAWLAAQLTADPPERERLATWILGEPGALPHAELAACLASPARNVMVFVSDWLGEVETYNRPGVVSEENWTLRVPRDYERVHRERASVGRALHLPRALALALRARGGEHAGSLARRLEAT
jgi:4-alpha-glucanotransferase